MSGAYCAASGESHASPWADITAGHTENHSHSVPDTVRPTGYCYPHAQQQALAQVQALFSDPDADAVAARSRLSRWLDAIFIGFLEEHPERAGEIFYTVSRAPSNALVRFLGDQAGTIDVIRVMTALPMGTIRQRYAMLSALRPFGLFLGCAVLVLALGVFTGSFEGKFVAALY